MPEVLTVPDSEAGETGHRWPEVLPGGHAVLFTIVSRQGRAVAVLDLETNKQAVLIPGGTYPRYASSGHIVYGAANSLWAVPFDVDRLEVSGTAVPLPEKVTIKPLGAIDFDLSATGSLVYAPGTAGGGARRSVFWVDRDGREEAVGLEPNAYVSPRLSPDGTRLAVVLFDEAGNRDIWVYDLARGAPVRLTSDLEWDDDPLWTPDGERIVFRSNREGWGLYWKRADGIGEAELLMPFTGPVGVFSPLSWSAAGSLVFAIETRETGSDIHVLSMDEERLSEPLLQTPFHERDPAVSPDGGWVAYSSDESGAFEVYVRPFPNVDDGRVRISDSGGVWPLWGPEGNELFYRNGQAILRVAIDTAPAFSAERPEVLFEGTYVSGVGRPHDLSPDGQRFLMLREIEPAKEASAPTQDGLVIVQNWFEELKRLVPTP
jgi:serine/threonine-protein kinase